MNQLFDSNKQKAQKELRRIIFEEEDDPFGISAAPPKTLEKGKLVPALQDGLPTNSNLKQGIQSDQVVHLDKDSFVSSKHSIDNDILNRKAADKQKGLKEYWEMNTPEMSDEVKRELEILSMRGYWDPKSFFKGSRTKKELPSVFEFGTVVAGPLDNRKNRLTRREKKASFADELASDISFKERSDVLLDKERKKRIRSKHKKHHSFVC